MNLAPHSPFFHTGFVLSLRPPAIEHWPSWVVIGLLVAMLCAMGYATRWWPDKLWPTVMWLTTWLAVAIMAGFRWHWIWWYLIYCVVVTLLWNYVLSFRGDDGRDDD